jgi:hypothetical protein
MSEKSPQLQTVENLFVCHEEGRLVKVKSCLTEDILYRVGHLNPCRVLSCRRLLFPV